MELELWWKYNGSMYLEWKYVGIRMELEWKWISTVEIGLKEVALISHHSSHYHLMFRLQLESLELELCSHVQEA